MKPKLIEGEKQGEGQGANSKSIEFFNVFSVLEVDIVISRVFC
jgi:hypothetical protein